MKWVTVVVVALAAAMWCTNVFATPIAIRNPNIPLAPAGRSSYSPAQLQAMEHAKAARNPVTVANSKAGWIDLSKAGMVGPVGANEQGLKGGGYTLSSKWGEQGGIQPLWGTNTTVMTGPLASDYPACRPISFDFDSAGNFYALVDSAIGAYPMRIYESTDDGQTWSWIWGMAPAQQMKYSKLVVVHKDSLFFYCFYVDDAGEAGVWRLNESSGTPSLYVLRPDSAVAISAAWDLDRVVPWFHVAIEKSGAINYQQIQYVRGTVQGTSWSTPSPVVYNSNFPSIATGNVAWATNNLFIGSIWYANNPATDSAAHVSYDSAGIWVWKKIGGSSNRREDHTQIAATHGHGTDSVRVWLAYTHWFNGNDQDIWYNYNKQNGQGTWVGPNLVAATNRQEWGASLNTYNWEYVGSINSFVQLTYYSDSGSTYRVQQDWLTNGYSDPTSWYGPEVVNDYVHSSFALSYASAAHRSGGGNYSVILYPGSGPTNVYFNGYWFTGVEQGPSAITPKSNFELAAAQPNPFIHNTAILFSLPKTGNMELAVFDVVGRKVATLAKGTMAAGSHEAFFNGSGVPAGVYFYRLNFEGKTLTNRMVIVR